MSAVVIIPARYGSSRFPGKPLAVLNGITLIQHVYQNSLKASRINDVIVATDNPLIFDNVVSFKGKAVMTSGSHESGTDRIAEVARSLDCDIIVNVQGDEPLVRPEMIDDVVSLLNDDRASIGTLARRTKDTREILDPNVVKVVFNENNFAIYFSRAPIPFCRDEWSIHDGTYHIREKSNSFCFKHIGLYSYRRETLIRMSELPPSRLERLEKLEQLRALENDMKIKIGETLFDSIGVDTPEDLERISQCQNLFS